MGFLKRLVSVVDGRLSSPHSDDENLDGDFFEIIFENVPKNQISYLEAHCDDYCWPGGLDTEEVYLKSDAQNVRFQFTTNKYFEPNELEDIDNNLLHSLIGKDQFFSNIWFHFEGEEVDSSLVKVSFIDSSGKLYRVELGKYCELEAS